MPRGVAKERIGTLNKAPDPQAARRQGVLEAVDAVFLEAAVDAARVIAEAVRPVEMDARGKAKGGVDPTRLSAAQAILDRTMGKVGTVQPRDQSADRLIDLWKSVKELRERADPQPG